MWTTVPTQTDVRCGWMETRINNSLEVGVLPRLGPDSLGNPASLVSERTQEIQNMGYLKKKKQEK